jgi:hypothetical protein
VGRSNSATFMTQDPMADASAKPNVSTLLTEYERAIRLTPQERMELCDQIRYVQWEGQSDDGRKYDSKSGKKVFPFDGASDTRIRLADEIINDNVDILCSGFERSQVNTEGFEARDAEVSGASTKALEWARNGGIPALPDEVEYTAQWGQTYGWAVLHTVWQRRIGFQNAPVTLQGIAALAQQVPAAQELLAAIIDPEAEATAISLVQGLYPLLVKSAASAIKDDEVPELRPAAARRVVRELREDGESELPIAYVSLNAPLVTALKPFEDVWFPPETADVQRARCIFRVDWMTEAELLSRVLVDGWDEEWVKQAIAAAGKVTGGLSRTDEEETESRVTGDVTTNSKRNLVEVVWAYNRAVNADGVEEVMFTVFCPHVRDERRPQVAASGPLQYAHGDYPFAVYRRERVNRSITASRGVPEIVLTWQLEKKVQRDALLDRTSLSISPPLKVPQRNMGRTYRLGPMKQVGVSRSDEIEWMEPPPGNPAEAIELIREIGLDANCYFGRVTEGVDPVRAQVKQQRMVNQFLATWLEVFAQVLSLMQQFMGPEEWEEITGAPMPERNFERIQRRANYRFHYDVRDANSDYMLAKLEAFSKTLLPMDAAGVIDRSKLAQVAASWIDPSIARVVVSERAGASQKLFSQVQNDIALMALGNEVPMVENDPTAPTQLQYAQEIVGKNPKYQRLLQEDKRFAELLEQWSKNRQFSATQEQNKVIGRIGVAPQQ